MGITGLILDTVILSSAAAGIRRATGYSIQAKVNDFITHPTIRTASNGFFNVGEFVVEKGASFLSRAAEGKKPPTNTPPTNTQ